MSALSDAKAQVIALWSALDGADPDDLVSRATAHLAPDFLWEGFAPLTETRGPAAFAETYLVPFRHAFPTYRRETHILCAGYSNGRHDGTGDGALWVGATGYLVGTAQRPFAGIPAKDQTLRLRWSDFYKIENGQITACQHLIDVIDWLEQIDLSPLPRPRGVPQVWPAPTGYDGVLLGEYSASEGEKTLELGRDLIFGGLDVFDGEDLSSMGMARYFHPNIKWYGPGGIGACFSHDEFTCLHQAPWLKAFPDRAVQDLDNLFAEDMIVAGSSFPGVLATHTGPYQSAPASGKRLAIHGIDFWLRDGDRFVENWVFVDFVHLFAQMGIDLLADARGA